MLHLVDLSWRWDVRVCEILASGGLYWVERTIWKLLIQSQYCKWCMIESFKDGILPDIKFVCWQLTSLVWIYADLPLKQYYYWFSASIMYEDMKFVLAQWHSYIFIVMQNHSYLQTMWIIFYLSYMMMSQCGSSLCTHALYIPHTVVKHFALLECTFLMRLCL